MRKVIKIGLISLAVIGIGVLVWLTLIFQDTGIKKVNVDDSFFTAQIKSQSEREITGGREFTAIMRSFNSMLLDVQDAAYLENIDAAEASNCKKLLAYSYAPRLTEHAKEYFDGHVWNASHLDTLRMEAQNLIGANILPSDSHDLPKLKEIIKNVNDYHAAVAATQVGGCTTVAAANAAISRAKSFKRAPLTNCTSLIEALNAVPGKVKTSLANNIVAACKRHSASSDALIERINEYERTFGRNSQLSQEKSKLLAAKRTARDRDVHNRINNNTNIDDEEIE